jgi:hypothetical protein
VGRFTRELIKKMNGSHRSAQPALAEVEAVSKPE